MGRTSTARKSRPRDAATKIAEQRLSVLELARELGNVAEACRRRDMVGLGMLMRNRDGSNFRRVERTPPPEARALIRLLETRRKRRNSRA